jgi:uncharacterized protein (DUF1810 family)
MLGIFDHSHFVNAQAGVYETVVAEIESGSKRSHWMWFIFPQLAGLGRSDMARRYAIGSVEEARAYSGHPVLGGRLRACVAALQGLSDTSAERVFGAVDAVKLRSSLTLFEAAGGGALFRLCTHCVGYGASDSKLSGGLVSWRNFSG